MKRFRCKKELILDFYDDYGFYIDDKWITVNVGDIYECDEDCQEPLMVAADGAIHLERVHNNDNIGQWIEIYPETLAEYFEEITEGDNG